MSKNIVKIEMEKMGITENVIDNIMKYHGGLDAMLPEGKFPEKVKKLLKNNNWKLSNKTKRKISYVYENDFVGEIVDDYYEYIVKYIVIKISKKEVEKYNIPVYNISSDSITIKGARDYSCKGKNKIYEVIDNEEGHFEIFHVYDVIEIL